MNRHLKDLIDLLNVKKETQSESVPPLKNEEQKSDSTKCQGNVEVVVFEKYHKKEKEPGRSQPVPTTYTQPTLNKPGFSFMKARNQVQKLGITGFEKEKKEEAKVALAIKLGARPPKNKYVNYKQLMAEKKMEKELEKNTAQDDEHCTIKRVPNRKSNGGKSSKKDLKGKKNLGKKNVGKKHQSKKNSNKVPHFDSRFGKFNRHPSKRKEKK